MNCVVPNPVLQLSLITPAFNEETNLPLLYERVRQVLDGLGLTWEWIIVDDHSRDATFARISDLAAADDRVRGIRFARNFGSHTAITCGLHVARGRCGVVFASDLQDPPELIASMMEEWKRGAQIVWAARDPRERKGAGQTNFARMYYWLMRRVPGLEGMPASGADFFLVDASVMEVFRRFSEHNVSVFALITWMGFRQATVPYRKEKRRHGSSGWTLRRKIKLVVDSITSFSFFPVRVFSLAGAGATVSGLIGGGWFLANGMAGRPVSGWAAVLAAVLFLGGIQLLMLALMGEYLWRVLEETRARPRYLIEATAGVSEPVVTVVRGT